MAKKYFPYSYQGGNTLQTPKSNASTPNAQAMGMNLGQFGTNNSSWQAATGAGDLASFGIPLSGAYEAGRRSLEDALQAALARIAAQRGEVKSLSELSRTRLGTDFQRNLTSLKEQMEQRGLFWSGINTQGQNKLGNLYERDVQDVTLSEAEQLANLAAGESEARLGYTQGLAELMLQAAAEAAAQGPYSALPYGGGTVGNATRNRRNRNRNRNRGRNRNR